MNRDIWKQTLTETHAPRWPCPTCGTGFLRIKDGPIKVYATKESIDASRSDHFYQGDATERFACVLQCDKASCAEPISLVGTTGWEELPDSDEGFVWSRYLLPLFFDPPLALIDSPRALSSRRSNGADRGFSAVLVPSRGGGEQDSQRR